MATRNIQVNFNAVLTRIHKMETSKNGKCLNPDNYINCKTHLKWLCNICNKTWVATYNNVINHGSWCPNCKQFSGESTCRAILEGLYPPFKAPTVRPDFLLGSRGRNLELDCYIEEFQLGLEYHGIQHYQLTPWLGQTKESFKVQQENDLLKKELCEENEVLLIEIPYTLRNLSMRDLKKLIYEKTYPWIQSIDSDIVVDTDFLNSNIVNIPNLDNSENRRKQFLDIAEPEGYCLEDEKISILNISQKFNTLCPNEHIYETNIDNFIHRGRRCNKCSRNRSVTEDVVRELINDNNVELISIEKFRQSNKSRTNIIYKCLDCKEETIKEMTNVKRCIVNNMPLCKCKT